MATHRRVDSNPKVLLGLLVCACLCPGPLTPRALAQELLQNGAFEDGAAPWTGCGGVSVVDRDEPGTTAAMVHDGRAAGRIGGPADGTCPSSPSAQLMIVQPVAIPADAADLTLSFWFSRLGQELVPDGNSSADMSVSLSTDPFIGMALFDVVSHNALRGWMPFRGHLRADDLAAFRGQTAYLRFAVQFTGDTDVTYLLDDVSLIAADVHTTAEPLPAALAGDGARPLVLLQRNAANPDGLTVVRLDTDGTKPMAIDTGRYHMPRLPCWSPDGSAIAVVDDDLFAHDDSVPSALKARISRLSVMRPDGTGRREVFATQGLEGSGSVSCQPPNCSDTRPALDQLIKGVEWSPDGSAFAVTVCARNRYPWGESGDDTCRVTIVDAVTGAVIRDDLDGWFGPDWSSGGRMLFNGPARYPDYESRGVWEGDPSVGPATQQLIVPAPIDLLVGGDRLPTWAPDGRRFVTAREIGGWRYDANGSVVRTEAVMLHDRDDLQNPRVLLVADHGGISGAIGGFTWSPDGRWILYTLYESANTADVWWLDVATGATGRVTNDGASVSVDWRQRANDGPTLGPANPGQGPDTPCAGEATGLARAACFLAAVASGVESSPATKPAGRRLSKRISQSAGTARMKVLQLAKKAPPPTRRVAKARKAIGTVAGLIAKAKTKGTLASGTADALAALATAAGHELDAL